MKSLIKGFRLILIFVGLGLIGCSQRDDGIPDPVPVKFLLTSNQKALFNYFTPNTVIRFFDSTSTNVFLLNADSKVEGATTKDFHLTQPLGQYINLYYSQAISYIHRLRIESLVL